MKQNLRRVGALKRLEAQLKSGVKNGTHLSEKDIKRIEKEISVLKYRIKPIIKND